MTCRRISKIALCAGSGGSLFKNLDVDLFFTGELSHHEALGARERGISTISCKPPPPLPPFFFLSTIEL